MSSQMHRITTFATATWLIGLSGTAFADTRPEILDVVGLSAASESRPASIYMVIPPAPTKGAFTPKAGKYVIYMNRTGGTYTPGFNDARLNRTSIAERNVSIPPWSVNDAGWSQVMSCVQDMFADYNVEITDQDPGEIPHIESVVAGRPQDLGLPPEVAGVSPFTEDCSIIDNSIVYTFAEVLGNDYQFICEVAAQEIAHSFGLDHQFLCEDPMTYLTDCGPKTFQNVDAQCGELEPRQCYCNGFTQNSVEMLTQRIGLRSQAPIDNQAPTLAITSPADGATVSTSFVINVDVADNIAISQIDLYIDGFLVGWIPDAPWNFGIPRIDPGTYTFELRAWDTSNNVTTSSIAVTVSDQAPDPANPVQPTEIVGGCRTSDHGSAGSVLLMLAAAWLAIRRKRLA